MPKEVLDAVERVVALGKEAIVRKEKGKWVVLESGCLRFVDTLVLLFFCGV